MGLEMKDVETGKKYIFKTRIIFPWTRQEFLDRVSVYQQKGVINALVTRKKQRSSF
jgi:hypothetical protein